MTAQSPKIFFFDLDGTLLNRDKIITPVTRRALDVWSGRGHKIVLCSGRAAENVLQVKEELGLSYPGMYVIGYNGGCIYDCDAGKEIFRVSIPFDQVSRIMDTAKEYEVHCHTYTDTHLISPRDGEELRYYCRYIHTPCIITDDIVGALDREPCKCICIELHDHEKQERFRKALLPYAEGKLTLMYSNPYYLEIFPSCSGKGTAVRKLCDLLGIPVSRSLAAGDAENDISMIQAAGTGIAMSNGADNVKKAADVVTNSDNDHDGLAPFLISEDERD